MVVSNLQPTVEVVYMSLDLGRTLWVLGAWSRTQKEPSIHRIKRKDGYGGMLRKLVRLIGGLRQTHGKDVELHLCFEASYLGYWLCRWLRSRGVEVYVIAPNSIEHPRKGRVAKTDRLDARRLVRKLKQYLESDKRAFSVVYEPTAEEEAVRVRQRERETLLKDRNRVDARMKGMVEYAGIPVDAKPSRAKDWGGLIRRLPEMKTLDGRPISAEVIAQMKRMLEQLELLERQLKEVEKEIAEYHASLPEEAPAVKLEKIKGIGVRSAQQLCAELMNWERFTNRKHIGKYVGLTSVPNESCGRGQGLGIGKDGNSQLRKVAIQLAWLWKHHQPNCALVKKYRDRLKEKGRVRRIAIVAMARELMTALWRYLVHGVEMEGLVYKKGCSRFSAGNPTSCGSLKLPD